MRYDIILYWIHCTSFGYKGKRAFKFQVRSKSAIKDHVYSSPNRIQKHLSVHDFTVLKKCNTEYEAKTQEVLVIKKQNPKLKRQIYVSGSSFLLNV